MEAYLRDPCGSLSVPYWKWKTLTVPEGMKILHEWEYKPMEGFTDTAYFRLYHDLKNVGAVSLPGVEIRTLTVGDFETAAAILSRCYGMAFDRERVEAMTRSKAYAPELWLLALAEGGPAGCVIAEEDGQTGEGSLEWVQVLPGFRRRGIGKALVLVALGRMKGRFATVSGRVDNETEPEKLYRACGFTGSDVWHILTRK